MKLQLAKVSGSLGSKLTRAFTRAKATAARVDKSELAEVIIAMWAAEFLRARRFTGPNIAGTVIISVAAVLIKVVVTKGQKKDHYETFTVSDWDSPMGSTRTYRDSYGTHRRVRHHRRRGSQYRTRE